MAPPTALAPPGVVALLLRALRLRCPACGHGALYTGWFAMYETCPVCTFRYEREQGYFVGAIYVNFALAVVLGLVPVVVADVVWGLTIGQQLAIAVPLMILVPVVCFRWSRSLWLAIDYFVTSFDDRAMRERFRRPPS
jgi:uncharacterized protein (DUF983 family)